MTLTIVQILKDNKMEGRLFARMFDSMRYRDVMIYLDISGNNLRDKDIPLLAAYIETSSQLSYLHMARNKFTSKAGEPLGKMMAQASLLELNVSANQLRGDGMASFLTSVAKSPSLERLNISWNGIGPEAVKGLVNLLKQSNSLIELDLTGTRINGECLDLICTQGLSKNGILQRLVLKNNPLLTQDLTTFLTRIFSFSNTAIRRLDLGDYQMLDSSVEELLEALFWEKQIYVRCAGTFTFSRHSDTVENIVRRLRKDSLALVARLDHGQRTALVKHFAHLDMQEAIETGSDIICNSFLGRANENKVTYKDLALRINQEKRNPRDVVNSILEKQEIPEGSKKMISRFSFSPEDIRKLQVLSRAS
ncbi:leucine-rich repeat-containing protein 74A [Elysia marginata]|uniref:Leucine-rich repeat-containing protein 74A n=1 Tax=Elysia marginata TaxID=1093978 RepID=A0AAV4FQI0_9GAST|nr:leucine-rich repeat-containing protein 74A [Elysia marginata]